jgi:GH35 family endo-1,4-beta-xylanase
MSHGAWGAEREQSQASDDEISARGRIEKYRRGDGVIKVLDAQGKGVAGVRVKLDQLRHDFLFGCNFFMFGRCGKPELEDPYRERFAALFNYCTLGFYWGSYEPEPGQPRYDYTGQVVDWTRGHGITCKGHPLVWDHPAGSPKWLPADPKEIQRLSDGRVRDLVSRFKGRIDIWDVVNEATHIKDKLNSTKMAQWAAELGAVPYVAEALKVARAANAHATLVVNDYRTDPPYYRILEALRQGKEYPFDVVGIQSHQHDKAWPLPKVWDICDTYAKLGRPLHFTETTFVSGPRKGRGENWGTTTPEGEARQADQTVKFYTALFAHPSVQAVTWWDFADYGAWQRAAAGWLRNDMSPKPVYERMMALIKGEWWTKAQGTTDAGGEYETRAFFGRHRATAELPNGRTITKEVHWEREKDNRFVLTA